MYTKAAAEEKLPQCRPLNNEQCKRVDDPQFVEAVEMRDGSLAVFARIRA